MKLELHYLKSGNNSRITKIVDSSNLKYVTFMDGENIISELSEYYTSGEIYILNEPTKEGYIFDYCTITSGTGQA